MKTKSSNSKVPTASYCGHISLTNVGKALGSSPDTINSFSFVKNGKSLVKGK